MAAVILQNITKVFDGDVAAVSDADIDVKDKEFMVIVGPSGCGKTTILRLIAGLEEPTAGTIRIAGQIVNDVPPRDRDVAMVFQNYALYPHMTVYQNMAFVLKLRKTPKDVIRQKVEETARMLGIGGLLNRKPRALSGGQRQRVAVGRAIVRNPRVFLFDEPLSNLDANLRASMRAELKGLHQRLQTTCIYVTHDQAEAMMLGDRICILRQGVVQQIAPPMEVYDRPVNRFVGGFIGTPAMNFFDGRIEFKDDRAYFVVGSDSIMLGGGLHSGLSKYVGREMVLGMRAENISLSPYAGQTGNVLCATVGVVEPLGDRKDVVLESAAGLRFIIRVSPHIPIGTGDAVAAYLDTGKAHIFEPGDAGRNVILA